MQLAIKEGKLRIFATLSITSVVLFFVTMIVASILKNILPKYHSDQFWIINLLKLTICIICTTLLGYSVRQIPSLLTLDFLKTDDFNPKDVKEARGTILVAPAFMFILGSTFTEYLPLFQTYNDTENTKESKESKESKGSKGSKQKTKQTKQQTKKLESTKQDTKSYTSHTACGMSASEDDIRCYLGNYNDLVQHFCPTFPSCTTQQLDQALCHYVNYGRKENRKFGC